MYEIRKVANGYLVMPLKDFHRGDCSPPNEQIYVFETYQRLCDKLHELLETKHVHP